MAIITCRECGKPVSDTALSCPQCGTPVADNPVVTLQRTGKGIKRQELFGTLLLVVSLGLGEAAHPHTVLGNLAGLLVFLGLIGGLFLLIRARIQRWWRHE